MFCGITEHILFVAYTNWQLERKKASKGTPNARCVSGPLFESERSTSTLPEWRRGESGSAPPEGRENSEPLRHLIARAAVSVVSELLDYTL